MNCIEFDGNESDKLGLDSFHFGEPIAVTYEIEHDADPKNPLSTIYFVTLNEVNGIRASLLPESDNKKLCRRIEKYLQGE